MSTADVSADAGTPRTRGELAKELLIGLGAVLGLTWAGLWVWPYTGYWSIALFYLVLVVLLATRLSRIPILLVAVSTGLLWNFLFIPPQYTLRIAAPNDLLMFAIYILIAATMGHITARLRAREAQARALELASITQRYELTKQVSKAELMEESERLYRTLFNCVSHELKTPLAVIEGSARQLRATTSPRGDAAALLGEIEASSVRLREIVDHFLDLSRIEAGQMRPDPQWCEIDELMDAIVERTRPTVGNRRVVVELAEDAPTVFVDSLLIEHALVNLIANAAQYSPDGTDIRLRARVGETTLELQVSDQGPGIPSELLGEVFRKFYRGPNAKPGGTGLGLAIVHGLAQALGGTVTAGNQPGGGACFSITVPVRSAKLTEVPP